MFDLLKSPIGSHSSPRARQQARLHLEDLETRCLMTVLTPAQVRHAYGFDQLPYDGSGQTIALVLANDNPTAVQDLRAFDRQFGLPDPVLRKATPEGQPAYDPGWALESSLDVEWAHAVAPRANLLLVEARSASLGDLLGAVDYARHFPGVSVVSMSWGGGEFPGESFADGVFTTPAGHAGVTFVAASGDSGGQQTYPATSPNVVAVGGTGLTVAGGTYFRETAWGGSGGGVSSYEGVPDYQARWQPSGRRTSPDVAYNADPNDGVLVANGGFWYSVGGTSAGAPQWAGLFALVDQGLSKQGAKPLDGRSQALPGLYALAASHYSTDFHDITSGRAGAFAARAGYDLVTGLGSPVANALVPDLVSYFSGAAGARAAAGTASNTGRSGGSSQGQWVSPRSVMAGPGGDAGLVVAQPSANGVGPVAPTSPATPTNVTPALPSTSGLRRTEPTDVARTWTPSATRPAHSAPVAEAPEARAETPTDVQPTPAAPDSPAAPLPLDPDEMVSALASLRRPRGAEPSAVTPAAAEATTALSAAAGTTPNALAAAAALALAWGVSYRGPVADARRRRQCAAGERP